MKREHTLCGFLKSSEYHSEHKFCKEKKEVHYEVHVLNSNYISGTMKEHSSELK